ncbi:hypothetical protein PTTG_11698 [Puccinia triticina 1-1 BBBD Race 1]|uniref:Uncharacterized protein n=1 Tax=Puccinia triticina (isolate 1-1 / race 1 (BBBD)) TaxID=630390 RepID=A0A180G6L4_PUCT1|nr:hypothetical protein PTTG_11698 [Puccinia triticina 1-1 BBBD Race 1]
MTTNHDHMDTSDSSSESDNSYSSSSDEDVDPELQESSSHAKRKARRAKEKARNEKRKISKIAESRPLPHPASALSSSVTHFVKFMMGLESSKSPLPPPPTKDEVSTWSNNIENRKSDITQQLSSAEHGSQPSDTTTKDNTANSNFLRNERLQKIRNEGLAPVSYTAAPEILSCVGVSSQTKQMVDKEFQRKGFSRVTFEWSAKSLSASGWNTATALILIENWSNWYKTQPQNLNDLKEDIQGIIERWLRTMRTVYKQQSKLRNTSDTDSPEGAPGQSMNTDQPGESVPQVPRHVLARHRKERKKISEHRYLAAKKLFPKNTNFAILFKDWRSVSDYEDNHDLTSPRIRVIPRWRSQTFTDVAHQLDVAAVKLQKSTQKRTNLTNLFLRGNSKDESEDADKPMEPLKKLPEDCYRKDYFDKLPVLDRRNLKVKDPIKLSDFLESLKKLTVAGYMNTDEPGATNPGATNSNMNTA